MITNLEDLLKDYASYLFIENAINETARMNIEDYAEDYIKQLRKENLLTIPAVVVRSEQCNHSFQRVERGGEFQGNQCECGEWEDLT